MEKTEKLYNILLTIVVDVCTIYTEDKAELAGRASEILGGTKDPVNLLERLSKRVSASGLDELAKYYETIIPSFPEYKLKDVILKASKNYSFKVFGVDYTKRGSYNQGLELSELTEDNCKDFQLISDTAKYTFQVNRVADILFGLFEAMKPYPEYVIPEEKLSMSVFAPVICKQSYKLTKTFATKLRKIDKDCNLSVDLLESISFDLVPWNTVENDITKRMQLNVHNLAAFLQFRLKSSKSIGKIAQIYKDELEHLHQVLVSGDAIYQPHLRYLERVWKMRIAKTDRIISKHHYQLINTYMSKNQIPKMLYHYDLVSYFGVFGNYKDLIPLFGLPVFFSILEVARYATEQEILECKTPKQARSLASKIKNQCSEYFDRYNIEHALKIYKETILNTMRKATRKKLVLLDVTKPINEDMVDKNNLPDCFGLEFDVKDANCHKCHDREACATIFGSTVVKTKVKKVMGSTSNTPLDEIDFQAIEEKKEKLIKLLRDKAVTKPMSVVELFNWFTKTSKCSDEVAVKEYFKTFIIENGFKTVNKQVLIKE